MWLFEWREGKIWKMALGQELQDVMGTDPWTKHLAELCWAAQSSLCRGTRLRTLAGGTLIPDAPLDWFKQPGEMPPPLSGTGPAGDGEDPWPRGCCWVFWLSPPSPGQVQGQILLCYTLALSAAL